MTQQQTISGQSYNNGLNLPPLQVPNSAKAPQTLIGDAMTVPAAFAANFDLSSFFPWQVWRAQAGRWQSTFDPWMFFPWSGNPLFSGWDVYYLDNVAGSNANSGLTPALAKKSMSSIVTLINAGANPAIVWVKGTAGRANDYVRVDGWNGGTRINKAVCIVGYGSRPRMGLHDNAVFALDGTYTNCYSTTSFTTATRCVDVINLDDLGDYTELTEVATPAECNTLAFVSGSAGYWCQDGSKIYVRRADGIAPIALSNTRLYRQSVEGPRCATSGYTYVWNLDIEGGNNGAFIADQNSSGRSYLFNVSGKWNGRPAGLSDAIKIRDCELLFCWRTVAAHAASDGFDVTAAAGVNPRAVFFDCMSYRNGISPSQSNNGLTGHQDCAILDINGFYFENYGANAAFVNTGCYVLLAGTSCLNPLGDVVYGGTIEGANYQVGTGPSVWLDNGATETLYSNQRDFSVSGSGGVAASLFLRNVRYGQLFRQDVSGAGVIADY